MIIADSESDALRENWRESPIGYMARLSQGFRAMGDDEDLSDVRWDEQVIIRCCSFCMMRVCKCA